MKETEGNYWGVVGAAIVDGENQMISMSKKESEGSYLHAERNAFEQFVDKFGEPSDDAFAVTTLSPCQRGSDARIGSSCTDLLVSNKIDTVYTGFVDPWQIPIELYEEYGLTVIETDDEELRMYCEELFEYFPRTVNENEDIDARQFVNDVLESV